MRALAICFVVMLLSGCAEALIFVGMAIGEGTVHLYRTSQVNSVNSMNADELRGQSDEGLCRAVNQYFVAPSLRQNVSPNVLAEAQRRGLDCKAIPAPRRLDNPVAETPDKGN